MPLSIDDFIEKAIPDVERMLARVNIAGGDRKPFYTAQLRSFFRDKEDETGLTVNETFGLRSLLVDAATQTPNAEPDYPPTLLRVYPRPREYGLTSSNDKGVRSRRLFLWSTNGVVEGLLRQTDAASDLLVAPFEPWPAPATKYILLPPLRLVDGRADVRIDLSGQLGTFLSYQLSTKVHSLFGGLTVAVKTEGGVPLLDATLVPQGIEFSGSLPDPTRDLIGGKPGDRIEGVFRLECDTRGADPTYLLRLVAAKDQNAINKTEDRIAMAMAGLAGSPVAIRYDKRPDVPPLYWPLEQTTGALKLKTIDKEFEMRIEAAAVDVRVKTQGISGDERGLATILAGNVAWIRKAGPKVELSVLAGTKPKEGVNIEVTFKKEQKGWSTALGPIAQEPFTVPLGPIAERLLPIYKAGGGVPQDATFAPYVFLPVQDGWLQVGLPVPVKDEPKDAGGAGETGPGSAMTGRVFVAHRGTNRGVVLDDAVSIDLGIVWKVDAKGVPSVESVKLAADGSKGQVLGMLYASESSPNALEALPTVNGGPVSTRDLPLWFGTAAAKPRMEGDFDWTPASGEFSGRFTVLPVTPLGQGVSPSPDPTDEQAAAIVWEPPANSAYISNFPLTRSLPSAPEPSVSRGLIPRRLHSPSTGKTIFTLKTGPAPALLPRFEGGNTTWYRFFSEAPKDESDRLILPTLAGTEFRPASAAITIDSTILRFDLPILDELFAWSDPPKKKATAQGAPDKQPLPMPTALQPGELALSWNASRDRMALTRTQAAQATTWIALKSSDNRQIDALVAPYNWPAQVYVEPDFDKGWGRYRLTGTKFEAYYEKDGAAEGLGGDKPVGFAVNGQEINKDDTGPIQIAGFAANLYPHKADGSGKARLWDSRGYALSAKIANGVREAWHLDIVDKREAEAAYSLLTSPELTTFRPINDEEPWSFAAELGFLVRDLPLKAGSFDGSTGNTPEGALGANGQAFDRQDFPTSLYEWRFFERPNEGEQPRHDIRWGPFVFKPLRLRNAVFGEDGKPTTIVVLGGMRFDRDIARSKRETEEETNKDGPFGPDEVYQRNDLFTLTLTLADGKCSYVWKGVKPLGKDSWPQLDDRDHDVSFPIALSNTGDVFKSDNAVPAIVRVDIVGAKAHFELRLFGSDYTISGVKVTPSTTGFTAELPAAGLAPPATLPTGVFAWISQAGIVISGGNGTLQLDGTVNLHALVDGKPSKNAIVALGKAAFNWLGIAVTSKAPPIEVDHATGQLSWRLEKTKTGAKVAPFDFVATGLEVSATLMAVASQSAKAAQKITPFGMSSVWMQVCATDAGTGGRMAHTLMASTVGPRDHSLRISWAKVVNSPICWPELSQFKNGDGTAAIPDIWLQPAKASTGERSRNISIAGDVGARLNHEVTLHLKAHRLDGDSLAVAGGMATVSRPVRLLAVTKHKLGRDKAWSEWTTLDHIVFTTPTQIAGTAKENTFAPLQNGDKYRDAKLTVEKGIAAFPLVLSGFFDTFLVQEWWKKATNSESPVMLGGAVAQFQDGQGMAHTAVVPWLNVGLAGLPPKDARLNRLAGTWRVPSADLWPATPLVAGPMSTVVIDRLADNASIETQFGAGRFSPDRYAGDPGAREVVPVEQAYFEKRSGDTAKPLVPADLEAAPFFLRAMMAIAARRSKDVFADETPIDWNVSTIQAGRFLVLTKDIGKPAVAAVRVTVRDGDLQPTEETLALVFADLIVLSRNRATRLERYRRIVVATAEDLAGKEARDEVAETASDVDADVILAVRVSETSDGHSVIASRTIPRPLGNLPPGKPLTLAECDIGASAALGWPTALGTRELAKLGPALGAELPLLGHESGFAGRFQMYGWPAFAPAPSTGALPDPKALYVSFANQIEYDRGTASKLGFDGPTARHLMPAPVRRRAPLSKVTEAALKAVLRPPAGTDQGSGVGAVATTASEHAGAAAILPPIIERGTIGRRPGVMEVAIASVTIPADEDGFDPEHERFGRPANSGPVAAHQLRNPRSPVLPADLLLGQGRQLMGIADSERITLGLRRRTYVSLADLDTTTGRLELFLQRPMLVDAARFETDKDDSRRHDRALFTLSTGATIDAEWNGRAEIEIEVASRAEGVAVEPMVTATGRIEVGKLSSRLFLSLDANGAYGSSLTFILAKNSKELEGQTQTRKIYVQVKQEGLGAIQSALREATADTPLRLVLELKDKAEPDGPGELPQGPRRQVLLPIRLDPGTRRVLPVETKSIVFGDPSYDRQLASQTASATTGGGDAFLLAADRIAYDLGSTLYFAAGMIDPTDGEFMDIKEQFAVSFARLPPQTATGDQPPPQALRVHQVASNDDGTYPAILSTVIEIGLGKLVAADAPPDASATSSPLMSGDRLQIVATLKDKKTATLQVDIVAEPVIAPPPSVYSVIETSSNSARVRLHAAAPLPQKIEFPDLLKDLALGHVRRRALFVWSYAIAGSVDSKAAVDLMKFDRSGGAQISKI